MSDPPPSRRVAFETARLRIARLALEGTHAREAGLRLVTQNAAGALAVERVGVWFFDPQNPRLVCHDLFVASTRDHQRGQVLEMALYPTYTKALSERRAIVADDARTHRSTCELTASYLDSLGISSMLDAPIIRKGRVVGVICHEHTGPARRWAEKEIDFACSSGDLAALILEQAERVELEAALKERAEERLEAQKLEALGRLARSIAHDFNNVLTVCQTLALELEAGGRDISPAAVAASLHESVAVGKRLTGQLLGVGNREALPVSTDLRKVIQRLMTPLKALAGAKAGVVVRIETKDVNVSLSEAEVEQILMNLVANARDAIGDQGRVEISLRLPQEGDDVPADLVVLEVSDNGTGMDARTRAHLFEPYFTTKPHGHGLGLATLYGIVKRAGGTVQVASEPGLGTRFLLALPRQP
jgi:signal transduction histidine kinase